MLTAALLGAGLFVILSNSYDASTHYWAFGVIGTLVWYWFVAETKSVPAPLNLLGFHKETH